MSIEIKNYSVIQYNDPFNYIPAMYIKSDLRLDSPVKSGDIKDEIIRYLDDELVKTGTGTYTMAKADLDGKAWEVHGTTKTEEGVKEWERVVRQLVNYLNKKVGRPQLVAPTT